MKPSAKIIRDSISPDGIRLTTMEVVMHRFVLAEFNTHRMFSRNSASSRAIPVKKQIQRAVNNPAMPIYWGENQKGMQAKKETSFVDDVRKLWLMCRDSTITYVNALIDYNIHKQITNRLLEPFMWHTVIVTATEWDNFFHQRCHPDAQPEMKATADAMQLAYYTSKPNPLDYGFWHLPYIDSFNDDWNQIALHKPITMSEIEAAKRVSVARCARVSYLNHDGVRSIEDDLKLYDRLVKGMHWSPFEHIATPCKHLKTIKKANKQLKDSGLSEDFNVICKSWGNLYGWHQFRKQFVQENRTRFIPNLPELQHIAEKNEK